MTAKHLSKIKIQNSASLDFRCINMPIYSSFQTMANWSFHFRNIERLLLLGLILFSSCILFLLLYIKPHVLLQSVLSAVYALIYKLSLLTQCDKRKVRESLLLTDLHWAFWTFISSSWNWIYLWALPTPCLVLPDLGFGRLNSIWRKSHQFLLPIFEDSRGEWSRHLLARSQIMLSLSPAHIHFCQYCWNAIL